LLAAFKKIMSMSDFQTSWIQIAFYGSYFCLALPAALFIQRFTYKAGILVGLGMFIAGSLLFYPASQTMVYGHFLIALFILAGGLSILETSTNPYIVVLGSPETGTRRLNLAQSFNPIGSITGVLLSKLFILSSLNSASATERAQMSPEQLSKIQHQELWAVMGPYVGVAVILILIWVLIAYSKMPKASDSATASSFGATIKRLIKRPRYVWGVVAQFFYVGAQIGVWSYTIRYVMVELNLNEDQASSYYLAALVLFMASRFVFTALMKYFKPGTLLAASSILAIVSTLFVIYGSGTVAVYALVSISGFMSLMFPTIYGIAIRDLGDDTKIGGSGLIMAILGGAVLTALQGQLSDKFQSMHLAYWIPLICFITIAVYGIAITKKIIK
jgi:FHS family L-fucose permease-like MFS transporter